MAATAEAAAAFPSSQFAALASLSPLHSLSLFHFWPIRILSTGINGISFVHLVLISVGTWLRMGSLFCLLAHLHFEFNRLVLRSLQSDAFRISSLKFDVLQIVLCVFGCLFETISSNFSL